MIKEKMNVVSDVLEHVVSGVLELANDCECGVSYSRGYVLSYLEHAEDGVVYLSDVLSLLNALERKCK